MLFNDFGNGSGLSNGLASNVRHTERVDEATELR